MFVSDQIIDLNTWMNSSSNAFERRHPQRRRIGGIHKCIYHERHRVAYVVYSDSVLCECD